ncbi:SDR family oxidoreductase [Synechococcus elongatus]|uniref:SDR family oxidoreductase n=1 Tax=Synechococcus elongatus TaxID=32046 RepID=UPI0030CD840B
MAGMSFLPSPFVLITGASSGIGAAAAQAFAQAGWSLLLLGRDRDRLQSVAETARANGAPVVETYSLDLTDLPAIAPAIAQLVEQFGVPDVLINNAGIAQTGPLATLPLAELERIFALNTYSPLLVAQALLPGMRQRQRGLILNLASIAAQQAFPDWGAYCASKSAFAAWSRVLAAEERSHGIRVSLVCPGSVDTALWDQPSVGANFDRQAMLRPETVAQVLVQVATLPETAVVDELTLMPNAGTF